MDHDRNTTRGGTATPTRPVEQGQRPPQRQGSGGQSRRQTAAPKRRAKSRGSAQTAASSRRNPTRATEPKRRSAARIPESGRSAPAPERPRRKRTQPEQQRRTIRRARPLPDDTPEVVYAPPRPFRWGKFGVQLGTMAAVVLALVFGVSLFFRTGVVTVSGNNKYTPEMVLEASGIQVGDSLFPLNQARISGRIIANLPYIKDVRVGVRLPDTVMLEIEELPVTYAVEARDGGWWLMSADGRLVGETTDAEAEDYTRVCGVQINLPAVGEQAIAAETSQTVIGEQTVVLPTTGTQRLEIALKILQTMEQTGFLGDMDSVDVTDASNLVLYTEEKRFRLELGDQSRLDYKLGCAQSAIGHLAAYESGVLDVSLTGGDKVIFTPAE